MVQGPFSEMVSFEEGVDAVEVCLVVVREAALEAVLIEPRLAKGTEKGLSKKLEHLDGGWA